MNELTRWFERQARRERRAVYLEEALLGRRFWRYALYRLRFFFVRYAVASATHAATVLLLYRFFDRTHFVIVLVVYALASVVTGFWWGALEALRAEVRRLYRIRAPHLIPETIGGWLSLSLQLALATAMGASAWLAVQAVRAGTLRPAELYVYAILLRLSLQFFTRAFHSGIYAIRRIYRPLPAILAVELLSVVVALLLTPLLGAWALPVGALAAVPTVSGLSVYFTGRAYRFLGLSPRPFVSLGRLHLPPRRTLRDFLGGGFSYALAGVDSLLVLVFFTTGRHTVGKTGLFALFFLLAPTVRAGSEWAQLLYFDLKRLELRLFRNLLRRFRRSVLQLAVAMGLLFSGVAVSVGALVYRGDLSDLAWTLVPFFVAMSLLAAVHIAAYADGSYVALALNALLCLGGYVAVRLTVHGNRDTVLLLAAVAFGGVVLLLLRPERLRSGGGRLLAPAEWLADIRTVEAPVTVCAAHFYREDAPDDDDAWRRNQVAVRIARRLRGGTATLIEPDVLVWFEPGAESVGTSVAALSGGLLGWRGSCRRTTGRDALREAALTGLLGGAFSDLVRGRRRPLDVDELRRSFARMFTSGIVYAPDEPASPRLAALAVEDKRAAIADAVAFARELRVWRPRSRFHVTALCTAGELRLIFLVSRKAPERLRARWEARVVRANLEAAL
jgi:hypothetical protein